MPSPSILVTCIISFLARALSSIEEEMFCWTAISSAGIVGILPGFLIRKSAIEHNYSALLRRLQYLAPWSSVPRTS